MVGCYSYQYYDPETHRIVFNGYWYSDKEELKRDLQQCLKVMQSENWTVRQVGSDGLNRIIASSRDPQDFLEE